LRARRTVESVEDGVVDGGVGARELSDDLDVFEHDRRGERRHRRPHARIAMRIHRHTLLDAIEIDSSMY
jgi:hypothetical protein